MSLKEDLRNKYLNIRKKLPDDIIDKRSKIITDKLKTYINEMNFKNIMIFISFRNEIRTHDLIKFWLKDKNKKIFVPYIDKKSNTMKICQIHNFDNDLKKGVYGILEPKQELRNKSNDINLDIVVVPGLLFTKKGYRIGYGGGYYDKFLSQIDDNITKVGIVYSDFILDKLPIDDYDIPVDKIITN